MSFPTNIYYIYILKFYIIYVHMYKIKNKHMLWSILIICKSVWGFLFFGVSSLI